MLIHDLRDNGQTQTNAIRLGGEERIEDVFQMFGLNAVAVIADKDHHIVVAWIPRASRLPVRVAGLNGVLNQVRERDLQEIGIEREA